MGGGAPAGALAPPRRPGEMPERSLIASLATACLASVFAGRAIPAQTPTEGSTIRVHVITLDSAWYVTGRLVAITGDSVVVRSENDGSRVAFERIHVLSVEQRVQGSGAGHGAIVGCAIVGGTLGLLALLPSHGDQGGDGEISGPPVVAAIAVAGCLAGGVVGAIIGAVNRESWKPITLPPRTGTEGAPPTASFGEPLGDVVRVRT